MGRCLIICVMLLAGCGPEPPAISLLDLAPCPGWTGLAPATEGQLARAAAAERAGRLCANEKLSTVSAALNVDH